ncbi:MAG: hypothetical protein OXB99_08360 [Acidimicrobiaceae bacterium]|nr:hypothetical protein [Acidimicrobiaceae bacterium]
MPAVAAVDELGGDDQHDDGGEGELGEAVLGSAVGVVARLSAVGQS